MAVDWEREAQRFLALFRASTQRYVGEAWLTELVTDLGQVSPAFREWWSRHDVQGVQAEHKHLIHPLVGRFSFAVIVCAFESIGRLKKAVA